VNAKHRWLRLVPFLPMLLIVWAIGRYGVDLPYWDEWALVPHLEKAATGVMPWADLWRVHNEHRLFVPQVLLVLLALISDWNLRAELWLNLAAALAAWFVLARILTKRLAEVDKTTAFLSQLVLALLIFSPSQHENWSWGWQIAIFLNVSMVAWALALLSRSSLGSGTTALAAGAGMVATFSFGNGLLIWPIGLLLLIIRKARAAAILWLVAATLTCGIFFYDYAPRPLGTIAGSPLERAKLLVEYVTIYLAQPLLGFEMLTLLYAGFVLLIICGTAAVVVTWRQRMVDRAGLSTAWAFMAFAGLSALQTGIGRLEFGAFQAASSRYVTIANFFWIGLLLLVFSAFAKERRRLIRAILVFCLVLLTINGAVGLRQMSARAERFAQIRESLLERTRTAENESLDLEGIDVATIFPIPETVEERLVILREKRWSLFRDFEIE
jgi:hypothetical protein